MIVLVATRWDSGGGGISAFNVALARALAPRAPAMIACAVLSTGKPDTPRMEDGVLLLPVAAGFEADRPAEDCGDTIVKLLKERGLPQVSHWLGHDLITGPAALAAAQKHGGKVVIIHHMDYLAYQNFGGGRGGQTADNHQRQIALLQAADIAFGVGSYLARSAQILGAANVHTIIPGFPQVEMPKYRKQDRLSAVTAGRFDEKSEPVKQVSLAVRAFGRAIRTGSVLQTLRDPVLTLLGVDETLAGHLEQMAADAAGRMVNLVPAPYDPDPNAFATICSRANLAILASRHEGFGLVGWEAIGTETPLILRDTTGLANQLRETLPTTCDSLATVVPMDCTDVEAEVQFADAIINIARDFPLALRKATQLRQALVNELGCTWDEAARRMLVALGLPEEPMAVQPPRPGAQKVVFTSVPTNHFPDCVELSLAVGQGATLRSVELITELRFGKTELDLGGVEVEIALRAARLRVIAESGRLDGTRLGDETRPARGLEARAGGIWALAAEKGKRLPNKALGDEALCRIEAPIGRSVSATVEVTAAKRDLDCKIHRRGRPTQPTTARVMETFLKNAIFKQDSGHILFSSARIEENKDADG